MSTTTMKTDSTTVLTDSTTMKTDSTMTTAGIQADNIHGQLKETCLFLAQYAASLLGSGCTSSRIEKNVARIAAGCGVLAEMIILPRTVMLTVWDKDRNHSYTTSARQSGDGIDFRLITLLSRLSWDVRDGNVTFADAVSRFGELRVGQRLSPWLVTLLVGLANASFCRLFSGDAVSMLIVFVATVEGLLVKNKLHKDWKWDLRIAILTAACLSAVIASSGYVFHLGSTPDVALATSVLYLIPGVVYINSVSDLIHCHLLCGFSRFMNAALITLCIGIGLSSGILLMNIHFF